MQEKKQLVLIIIIGIHNGAFRSNQTEESKKRKKFPYKKADVILSHARNPFVVRNLRFLVETLKPIFEVIRK